MNEWSGTDIGLSKQLINKWSLILSIQSRLQKVGMELVGGDRLQVRNVPGECGQFILTVLQSWKLLLKGARLKNETPRPKG